MDEDDQSAGSGQKSYLMSEDIESQIKQENKEATEGDANMSEEYYERGQQVVLHEEKQYYPEAQQIFGKGVEAIVEEEDHQPLTQPIIEPPKDKFHQVFRHDLPELHYSTEFLAQLMQKPQLVRSVAILGHLHHGKTLLSDLLIESTMKKLPQFKNNSIPQKYTDTRIDEINRQISIKRAPYLILLTDSRDKNYVFNMLDCPGHPNFSDEVTAALRLADNVLLVVDVVEGVTAYNTQLIEMALKNNSTIILVLNKLDRLALELKLPPNDAYHKIKHTLDEVNMQIQRFKSIYPKCTNQDFLSPLHGNVVFGSTLFHTLFSIQSFASVYATRQ